MNNKILISILFMTTLCAKPVFCCSQNQAQVVDFVYEKDVQDVLQIIQEDWKWLFTKVNPTFDHAYVLQHEIPNKELLVEKPDRELKMKVFRIQERVAGFVSYYKENSDLGRVRLVSISQEFREKECDKKLTIAAVRDLFDLGCTSVYLYTDKRNEKVHMYESLGFKEDKMPEDSILWYKEQGFTPEEYAQYALYSVNQKTFRPSN